MNTLIELKKIKNNPSNPRTITQAKFEELVESIRNFPEMLEARPIVLNPDYVVIGGNQRLRACRELGWKEVPCYVASWEEAKNDEFILKDNLHAGYWDMDIIANEFDTTQVQEWGLHVMERIHYEPNILPDMTETILSEEDMEKARQKLTQSLKKGGEAILHNAMCPECGHEFSVEQSS